MLNMKNETALLTPAPVGVGDYGPVASSERENSFTINKDVALTASKTLLSVHSVPNDKHYFHYSNLFQCSVVVEKNKFTLYYEHPDGTQTPVLRADKQKTSLKTHPKYHIFDISQIEGGAVLPLEKVNTEYLGKLRREKHLRIHSFALHSEREGPLSRKTMHILYQAPSMLSVLKKQSPRKAQVAIYHEASDSGDLGNTLSDRVVASMKDAGFLDRVADPDSGLYTVSSKEPYRKANGDYALNFYNRCLLSNTANMQLEDEEGRVVLQVAQVDDNKFSVDFR